MRKVYSPCGRYSPLPTGPGAGEEVVDLADLADLAELADDVAVAALHRAKSSESLVGVSTPNMDRVQMATPQRFVSVNVLVTEVQKQLLDYGGPCGKVWRTFSSLWRQTIRYV